MKTVEDWQEAFEALGKERAGRGPESFPIVLGIEDPGPLNEWCAEDAADTVTTIFPQAVAEAMGAGQDMDTAIRSATATIAATHTQIGIEMGLWLVQKGLVQP